MPPRPDRAAARSAFLLVWHDEAEAHFQIEEQILLPALHGLDAADEPVNRVLAEHAVIRRRPADLSDGAQPVAVLLTAGPAGCPLADARYRRAMAATTLAAHAGGVRAEAGLSAREVRSQRARRG
jgi:hemerythrin HHE cation binding domain-containing protein